jgi:hypothetical protein
VDSTYSGPYPLTCLTWVTLPGAYAPASIALEVISARKPPHPQHALRQGGSPWGGLITVDCRKGCLRFICNAPYALPTCKNLVSLSAHDDIVSWISCDFVHFCQNLLHGVMPTFYRSRRYFF